MTASGYQFRGFISHSGADAPAARRLKRRLENFAVPSGLRRAHGPLLGRFLRSEPDETDQTALALARQEQLAAVEYLIVCCSPAASNSATVDVEITAFLQSHGRDKLLAVLFQGEPRDALPRVLRTGEMFGVDLRPSGDGEDLGLARLAARMLGADYGEMRDQMLADQRMRIGNRNLIAAGLGLIAVTASATALIAVLQRYHAEAMAENAVDVSAGLLSDADSLAAAAGAKAEDRRALIESAQQRLETVFADGVKSRAIEARRAALMLRLADLYGGLGDSEKQGQQAGAALEIYDALPSARRSGVDYARALAAVGAADLAAARADAAIDHLTRAAAAARPLVAHAVHGPMARQILADSLRTLGDLHTDADRPEDALPLLGEAAPLLETAASAAPQDADALATLVATLDQLGEAQLAAGDRAAAKATMEKSITYARAWRGLSPQSAEAKAELAFALLKLGGALAEENNPRAARAPLGESLVLMRELTAGAPREARYRSGLTLLLWTSANALIELRQDGDALMDEAIGLVREDAARAPRDNALKDQLARMLAVRAARHAGARQREAARDTWGEIVQLRRAIRNRTPQDVAAPSEDLAAALEQLGDLNTALRERDPALAAYREAVQWRRQALTAMPQSIDADAALAAMLQKYANARLAADDRDGAIRPLAEAARRRRALAEAAPDNANLAIAAVDTLQQVAALRAQTDPAAARVNLEQAIALLERLAGDYPEDARYRARLRRTQARLAQIAPPS